MKIRSINARNRNLSREQSLWHPLFLQLKPAARAVEQYFRNLSRDKRLKIYDFGCGQKPYQVYLENHDYIGIDIDEMNTQADIHSDISNVPIPDNTADIVTSFYVLEHVPEPQKVIDEKYRILKNGGE
ncbi:MAG: class I SAM-dependent methyltransferase, partial [Candidatus Electrothrix sp. MAN1_4]|nr:class I SAM-dependent methyltransferase [Candidatus Electrothrix sp. MAN1_4]